MISGPRETVKINWGRNTGHENNTASLPGAEKSNGKAKRPKLGKNWANRATMSVNRVVFIIKRGREGLKIT